MPVAGIGNLIVNDVLTDCAFALVEPSVNTTVPVGGIASGTTTVNAYDPAMYVGAQVVVGFVGNADLEVVTITAVVPGTSFTAVFQNSHVTNEPIVGATFPVRQPTDPFFTQTEVLDYLSESMNDFLRECPLAVAVSTSVSVSPTAQNAPLPTDCMLPTRVAASGVPFREASQSELDQLNYRWQEQAPSQPYVYFRDKTGLQKVGVWPRANNTTNLEIVYNQRSPETLGLADGFIIPDPFLIYVKYRVLSMCYSKDGEQRNPALAKYYSGRYDIGVKVCQMYLSAMTDPNLDAAQS